MNSGLKLKKKMRARGVVEGKPEGQVQVFRQGSNKSVTRIRRRWTGSQEVKM